jgi:hypothetical protein
MGKLNLGSLGLNLRNLGRLTFKRKNFSATEGTAGNYTVYTDKINSKDN